MELSASSMQSNVEVSLVLCSCGDFHVSLVTIADLCHGDVLAPMNSCPPRILVQFDGSAHRLSRKDGGFFKWSALGFLSWTGGRVPGLTV